MRDRRRGQRRTEIVEGNPGLGYLRALLAVVAIVLVGAGMVAVLANGGAEGIEVGDRAPTYSAPSLSGGEVSLADYRGRVVMINIWATWCGPCRVEMPSIQEIYDRYREDGFTVLAVSIDQGGGVEQKVRGFVEEYELEFPVLLDPESRITRLFRTAGVPETFVIDREGRIVKRVIGASNWNSESNRALIEELLRM